MTYLERPLGKTGAEASLDGGKTWRRVIGITMTAANAQKCFDGTKTQTRRLMNPQPTKTFEYLTVLDDEACTAGSDDEVIEEWKLHFRVGEILYIREPWKTYVVHDRTKPTDLPDGCPIFYYPEIQTGRTGKLRPAMFLPRRFARPARYEVTAVKCERVNAISHKDVLAEGVGKADWPWAFLHRDWKLLWNSIHMKPCTRFEDARYVWCYEFKRIK